MHCFIDIVGKGSKWHWFPANDLIAFFLVQWTMPKGLIPKLRPWRQLWLLNQVAKCLRKKLNRLGHYCDISYMSPTKDIAVNFETVWDIARVILKLFLTDIAVNFGIWEKKIVAATVCWFWNIVDIGVNS